MAEPSIRSRLLGWYDTAARDLPWRRTRDPYAIWVSEIMLQQTRVETVIPYYERFLARFPSATALAAATEDEVLAHWSGLGYYRRARMLHAGAREVVARYGGDVPPNPEQIRGLPGVGRYTAGAIASIAFDLPEPLVDGNVARVLSRIFAIATPLDAKETQTRLWSEASALARGPRPGALNQALMELGATVCTPRAPSCGACPVARECIARRTARVADLPVVAKKKAPREIAWVAVAASASPEAAAVDRAWWLTRGDKALFGGLWGLPMGEGRGASAARAVLESVGVKGELEPSARAVITHVLTHRKLSVEVWCARRATGRAGPSRKRVTRDELAALGVSRLTHKLLDAVDGEDGAPVSKREKKRVAEREEKGATKQSHHPQRVARPRRVR